MTSTDFQSTTTIIGLLLTGIGLIFAGTQLRDSKRIAGGDFLPRFDEMLKQHNEVHTRLRPGGIWAQVNAGSTSVSDWAMVEAYMGLFERIKILIDSRIIDIDAFERLYGYRVVNILSNDTIRVEKLCKRAAGWKDFIALCHALEKDSSERSALYKISCSSTSL